MEQNNVDPVRVINSLKNKLGEAEFRSSMYESALDELNGKYNELNFELTQLKQKCRCEDAAEVPRERGRTARTGPVDRS